MAWVTNNHEVGNFIGITGVLKCLNRYTMMHYKSFRTPSTKLARPIVYIKNGFTSTSPLGSICFGGFATHPGRMHRPLSTIVRPPKRSAFIRAKNPFTMKIRGGSFNYIGTPFTFFLNTISTSGLWSATFTVTLFRAISLICRGISSIRFATSRAWSFYYPSIAPAPPVIAFSATILTRALGIIFYKNFTTGFAFKCETGFTKLLSRAIRSEDSLTFKTLFKLISHASSYNSLHNRTSVNPDYCDLARQRTANPQMVMGLV